MEPRDVGSQSALCRHSPMQWFRTRGCSGKDGDREAHQGQPCQTSGCENRKRLGHQQLQHGQNLKQSLRSATIPAWYRCNPLRQRRQASDAWPTPTKLSPSPEAPMASGCLSRWVWKINCVSTIRPPITKRCPGPQAQWALVASCCKAFINST